MIKITTQLYDITYSEWEVFSNRKVRKQWTEWYNLTLDEAKARVKFMREIFLTYDYKLGDRICIRKHKEDKKTVRILRVVYFKKHKRS